MKWKLSQISVLLALWLTFHQPITRPHPITVQDEEQERDIESTEVLRGRRRGKNPQAGRGGRYRDKQPAPPNRVAQDRDRKSPVGQTSNVPKNATVTDAKQFPVGPPPKGKTYITLGITLWRVRLATESEREDAKVPKEVMTWNKQEHEVVVTRISDDSPVTAGDLIQISIEYLPDSDGADLTRQNRAGYLYVINREEFPGNVLKNPRLIFPTQLTYEGDNRLLPGKTVTLPEPNRPFRIKRGSEGGQSQAYETYTFILSPDSLKLPQKLDETAMVLPTDLVGNWERELSMGEVRADLLGGVGQTRTRRELRSSGDVDEERGTEDTEEDLTQADPPPQIVFRRAVEPGAAMMVTVRLPFKGALTRP